MQARHLLHVARELLRRKAELLDRMAKAKRCLAPLPASTLEGTDAAGAFKAVNMTNTRQATLVLNALPSSAQLVALPIDQTLYMGDFLTDSGAQEPFSLMVVNNSHLPVSINVTPVMAASLREEEGPDAEAEAGGVLPTHTAFQLQQSQVYVPAGGSAAVTLRLNAAGLPAAQYRQRYTINCPQLQEPACFTMHASLQDLHVDIQPRVVEFGKLCVHQESTKHLHVTNRTNVRLRSVCFIDTCVHHANWGRGHALHTVLLWQGD